MPQTPPSPPPAPWMPEPADAAAGDARTVVYRMAAVMGLVVVVAVGLLGAHWYASRPDSVDFEEALREGAATSEGEGYTSANGGAPDLDDGEAVLDVDSPLDGSTVFVDGDSVGVTPLRLSFEDPGARWVLVARGGRTLLDTTLQVGLGEVALLTAAAREPAPAPSPVAEPPEPRAEARAEAQSGAIRVTSSPAGAAVLLDGRGVGETPLTIDGLDPGRYSLAVRRTGYESVVRTVTIRPGTRYEAALDLQSVAPPPVAAAPERPARPRAAPPPPRPAPAPATGVLEVLVRPWGRIEIDGQVRQRESDVVYRTELPVGRHRIRVSHPVLGSQEREVVVDRGVTYRLDIDLDNDG